MLRSPGRRQDTRSVREVEQYIVHPNEIRTLGVGRGIVTIPHPQGVKVARLRFARREDLPAVDLPEVPKRMPEMPGYEKSEAAPDGAATDTVD